MPETTTHMTEVEYCLICNRFIDKGNDPALCGSERCKTSFEYECAFNRFAADKERQVKCKKTINLLAI